MTTIFDIEQAFSYEAHKRYDPYERVFAAVLIPLIQRPDGLHMVFQVRSSRVYQGGDVCFPGGHREPGETFEQAALRETVEELRIEASQIRLIGPAHEFWSPSRRVVRSFVGLLDAQVNLSNFEPQEVSEVFTVPLAHLLDAVPEIYFTESLQVPTEDFPFDRIAGGRGYDWPRAHTRELFYEYQGHTIWGLTAELLHAFLEEIKAGAYDATTTDCPA